MNVILLHFQKSKLTIMLNLQSFVFNGFQENTYVLYDETKECVIIDPDVTPLPNKTNWQVLL